MKAGTLIGLLGAGALVFLGFKTAKGNTENAENLNVDRSNLSQEKDWYKIQAQNLKTILKSGFKCPQLADKFLEVYQKLNNIDDWKQLYEVFGHFRKDAFKKGDLIFFTKDVFNWCGKMNALNRVLIEKGIYVFSKSEKRTTCENIAYMKRFAPKTFQKNLDTNRKFKAKAKECGLI